MAIARGAGTEIIRSAMFRACVGDADTILIVGEQHHIYTLLNLTLYCRAINAGGAVQIMQHCYDSKAASGGTSIALARWNPSAVGETFVWDNKLSFNGHEPTDFSGTLDATKQNAIADQGHSVSQKLALYVDHANTQIDVHVTFIDQNNA